MGGRLVTGALTQRTAPVIPAPDLSYSQPVTLDGETVNVAGSVDVLTTKITRISTAAGYTYIGKADPGSSESDPVWQIIRIHEVGDDMTSLSAGGNMNFDNRWDQRLILDYS